MRGHTIKGPGVVSNDFSMKYDAWCLFKQSCIHTHEDPLERIGGRRPTGTRTVTGSPTTEEEFFLFQEVLTSVSSTILQCLNRRGLVLRGQDKSVFLSLRSQTYSVGRPHKTLNQIKSCKRQNISCPREKQVLWDRHVGSTTPFEDGFMNDSVGK